MPRETAKEAAKGPAAEKPEQSPAEQFKEDMGPSPADMLAAKDKLIEQLRGELAEQTDYALDYQRQFEAMKTKAEAVQAANKTLAEEAALEKAENIDLVQTLGVQRKVAGCLKDKLRESLKTLAHVRQNTDGKNGEHIPGVGLVYNLDLPEEVVLEIPKTIADIERVLAE